MLIALDRAGANVPLQVSLFTCVEMLKAAWIEQLTVEGIVNCFRKVGFMVPRIMDDVKRSRDLIQVELRQCVIGVQLAGPDVAGTDFVGADNDAEIAELCSDKAIAR